MNPDIHMMVTSLDLERRQRDDQIRWMYEDLPERQHRVNFLGRGLRAIRARMTTPAQTDERSRTKPTPEIA
jgi:hypothetical protein